MVLLLVMVFVPILIQGLMFFLFFKKHRKSFGNN